MTKIASAARACVVHENKLLLVSNNGGHWYLPGGHMEPRENLATCAKREVYEETGYDVEIQDILYVYEFYDKDLDKHKVECVFRASILFLPGKNDWHDLGIDQSVTMSQWFTLEEIQNRTDMQPQFFQDGKWLTNQSTKVYRGYDVGGSAL